MVELGEVVVPAERAEAPEPGKSYRQIGVRLWGEGAYERESVDGAQTKYKQLFRAEAGDIILNKIWARNGSVAVVSDALAGCYGSGEFPMFTPKDDRLDHRWIHWLTKTPSFWEQCDEKSRGTSGKNRIKPEQFLRIEIPLPALDEQKRILARLQEFQTRITAAVEMQKSTSLDTRRLLIASYFQIIEGVPYQPIADVAPLQRRPVTVDPAQQYNEIGIRSFGKGTFHKSPVTGAELGAKRIFHVENGDLLFNIVFAWEGAVALATPQDEGRVGSHRFLTCVPKAGVASAHFLCFHFLTRQGLEDLSLASPGGAGRNRTLGLKALEEMRVPVPSFEKQRWFDSLLSSARDVANIRQSIRAECDALMPSILDKAFRGKL